MAASSCCFLPRSLLTAIPLYLSKNPELYWSSSSSNNTKMNSNNSSNNNNSIHSTDSSSSSSPSKPMANSNNNNNSSSNRTTTARFAPTSFQLLLLLVFQNTATVLVGRYTRAGIAKEDLYTVNHLIFLAEVSKFLLALGLEHYTTGGRLRQSLQLHILDKPLDALKILVPALLYLFQNTLLYVALSHLTAPLFQVIYQGKLVTTAIVSVMMLQRNYVARQWMCIVALSLGVAIVVLGERQVSSTTSTATDTSSPQQVLSVGLTAVCLACLSSALASVYFEKVLKNATPAPSTTTSQTSSTTTTQPQIRPPASLWMRNVQMAFFSMILAFVQGQFAASNNNTKDTTTAKPYLHGFTLWVWVLVALQAWGGLLVAAVIKYADNVLKGLATGASVVVSSLLSMLLFRTHLGMHFAVGACIILTSVYFFSNPLPPVIVEHSKQWSMYIQQRLHPSATTNTTTPISDEEEMNDATEALLPN